ncbi:hypothetical protein KK137_04100 [Croceibacterium sp. LX-88]|uniref:Uncharacterized protein n=1 Tax=Croceibacterium selenioxidans TaxID=2838833 RepID=A0ABS5W161_9SPHN|nr:hypothetical protein [Croceibacterium selenioxidans]MBT2133510.1 hypothetical protein [Croceibacterium selenioxidans]
MRNAKVTHRVLALVVSASMLATLPAAARAKGETRANWLHDVKPDEFNNDALKTLRAKAVAQGCESGDNAQSNIPEFLPAAIAPIILFAFNLLTRSIETELSRREERELATMSNTWSGVITKETFSGPTSSRMTCILIRRSGEEPSDGSAYVVALRLIGTTAFTIEPVTGWLGSSSVLTKDGDKLNATVSITIQYVATQDGSNELVTLPAYAMDFEGLAPGKDFPVSGSARASPVLPLPSGPGTVTLPTSVVLSVTEANTRLESRRQQIALAQANRAALMEALGTVLEGALSN